MRFLGIDYGTRRIGLAAGDELGIATPLPDGGALVLERSFSLFSGFGGRLTRLSAAALRAANQQR